MKKNRIAIVLLTSMVVSSIFTGCSSSDIRKEKQTEQASATHAVVSTQQPESAPDTDEDDEISFGYTTVSEKMMTFDYDGKELHIPYYLETIKATGHDVGFLVFINGVLQNYSIQYADGKTSETSTMQKLQLDKKEKQQFEFVVQPSIGKAGDKLGIYICNIIYPSFIPKKVEEPSYQYYHSLSGTVPQQIRFKADTKGKSVEKKKSKDGVKLSDTIINAIKAFSSASVEETLKDNVEIELYQNENDENVITSKNGKIQLHLKLYGGVDGRYNTTIFINNEPITIDGANCIESNLKSNTMSEYDVTIDISKYDKLNTIYAIAVPADSAYLQGQQAIKSSSVLVENDTK